MFRKSFYLFGLLVITMLIMGACQPVQRLSETKTATAASAQTPLEQANQAIVQRFYEEVINQKKFDLFEETVDPASVAHELGMKLDLNVLFTGLPDLHITVDRWVLKGDMVTSIVTLTGTHEGEMMGVAPTHKKVTWTHIDIHHVQNGKIVEVWHDIPLADILAQIGYTLVPPAKSTSDTSLSEQAFFTGTVEAQETYTVTPPTMLVDTTGSGESTELGTFTVAWEFTVNIDKGTGVGSAHFIAANGDSLDTTSLGQGEPSETPDVNRVVEQHTIRGGTGRYAGATGSFTLERMVSTVTGVTSGSFAGIIVLQKAK